MDNNFDNSIVIDKEKFTFVQDDKKLSDKKFDTKPVGYFQDAMRRFVKNKSSVVAVIIIVAIVLYAIFVPVLSKFEVSYLDPVYKYARAKNKVLSVFGVDGTYKKDVSQKGYDYLLGIGVATADYNGTGAKKSDGIGKEYTPLTGKASTYLSMGKTNYKAKVDSYLEVGFIYLNVAPEDYEKIIEYESTSGLNIVYPMVDIYRDDYKEFADNANYWYLMDSSGRAVFDANGQFQEVYRRDENNNVAKYLIRDGRYFIRVLYYNYYIYQRGFEPAHLLGADGLGQDIFVRSASGIRTSLILAICVAIINFLIGALWGSICGYFGGAIDLILERLTDILVGIPFIVVSIIFRDMFVLTGQVPVFIGLLFAFVLTGWVGTAGTVRMQFYRFKRQEYVLAARTLGARDGRLMFKHIFPNTLGTLITSSALAIPSVIFTESSLAFLGIMSLDTLTMTSLGSMLQSGHAVMQMYPHVLFPPAIIISLLMICFNLFGNGLRDAFNPSLRGSDE